MNNDSIGNAILAAQEFVRRASLILDPNNDYSADACSKATSALRRQSMELTRALAEMRKP